MFTICIALYASLVSVDAIQSGCYTEASKADVAEAIRVCKETDKDPLTTCEANRVGALKVFITVRRLEGT